MIISMINCVQEISIELIPSLDYHNYKELQTLLGNQLDTQISIENFEVHDDEAMKLFASNKLTSVSKLSLDIKHYVPMNDYVKAFTGPIYQKSLKSLELRLHGESSDPAVKFLVTRDFWTAMCQGKQKGFTLII
jgi:hypothetical protein